MMRLDCSSDVRRLAPGGPHGAPLGPSLVPKYGVNQLDLNLAQEEALLIGPSSLVILESVRSLCFLHAGRGYPAPEQQNPSH